MAVYMALSFFERPAWCYGELACDNGDPAHVPPTFGLWVMPLWISQTVEGLCVLVFFWEMVHKVAFMSRRTFFSSPAHVAQLLILLLDAAGIIVSAISADTLTFFNPLLRPLLFAAMSVRTRRALATFFRVLPSLGDWSALLLLLLAFYALLGVCIFGPPDPLLGDDGVYFHTLPRALLSLVVLITTANFPDVMLSAYSASRASVIFFATFLLMGTFFLLNMFLAEIVVHYKRQVDAEAAMQRAHRNEALRFAFELLDFNQNRYVRPTDFIRLVRRMQRPVLSFYDEDGDSAGARRLDSGHALASLQALLSTDSDLATTGLDVEKFIQLLLALKQPDGLSSSQAQPKPLAQPTLMQALSGRFDTAGDASVNAPSVNVAGDGGGGNEPSGRGGATEAREWGSAPQRRGSIQLDSATRSLFKWLRLWLTSSAAFELGLALILLGDAALLCAEIVHLAAGRIAQLRALLTPSAPVFGCLYTVEMGSKLWRHGVYRYVSDPAHLFDGAVTLITVAADVATLAIFNSKQHTHALRIALALRTLRLLRVFTGVSRFQSIFRRFVRLLPTLTGLFGLLWFTFSVYAQLGVLCFGGSLYAGAEPASGYSPAPLYVYCNFNDFGSAFITLFELLVQNNWQEIMAATAAVNGELSRIYFITWWVLGVLVISNLLVAFIISEMSAGALDQAAAGEEPAEQATSAAESLAVVHPQRSTESVQPSPLLDDVHSLSLDMRLSPAAEGE